MTLVQTRAFSATALPRLLAFTNGSLIRRSCNPQFLKVYPMQALFPVEQSASRETRSADALLLALIAIHLVAVWAFAYFPTRDGPSHVYNANLLREFDDFSVYRQYFLLNLHPDPTWFCHTVLAGLMSVFPPLVAEKVLISLYVILLPLCVRYALKPLRPGAEFLALLAVPFTFNYLLHMGFYSWVLSLPMTFLLLGYWFRNADRWTVKSTVVLALLSMLLYLSHIVSLVMVYTAIGVLLLAAIALDLRAARQREPLEPRMVWKVVQARTWKPFLAFVPTVLLVAIFLLPRETRVVEIANPFSRLAHAAGITSLISYNQWEAVFTIALACVFAALAVYFLRRKIVQRSFERRDLLLLIFPVWLAIYATAPETVVVSETGGQGGWYMRDRLSLFPYFALLLWFGAQIYTPAQKKKVQFAAVFATVGLLVLHMFSYRGINRQYAEYLSGMHLIEPNSTLLPVHTAYRGYGTDDGGLTFRADPFRHLSGYIAARRHVVSFDNYETQMGYFPALFRSEVDPYEHLGRTTEDETPAVNLRNYAKRTGGRVDYVLVWLGRKRNQQHDNTVALYDQLQHDYELVFTSPNQLMELFRNREFASLASRR